MTIAGLEQTLVVSTGGMLNAWAVLSWIAAMMVGSELPNARAIAVAISLERDKDAPLEATVTAMVAADEEGDDMYVLGIMPTAKML